VADNDEFEDSTEETPKDLRRQLAKAKKDADELRSQMTELLARDRKRTISDLLSEKGLPAKVANLLPDTVEADPAAIDAWLTEYADVFGVTKTDATDEPDGIDPEAKAAHERLANATAGATPAGKPADLLAAMQAAASPEELAAVLARA